MKRMALLLALVATLGMGGCSAAGRAEGVASVAVDGLERALAASPAPRLIDVREPDEYASGHVPGAESVPLGQVEAWATTQPKDAPYLIVCQTGRRSLRASSTLAGLGFSDVTNVEGGTSAWQAKGLPLAR